MFPRLASRWNTPFARWLDGYTVPRIVESLRLSDAPITDQAVYHWVAGRTSPRLEHAEAIVRLSEGRVTITDIVSHRRSVLQGKEL